MALDGSGAVVSHQGTINGLLFRGFVWYHLLPALCPGDVVIWDDVRIHGVEGLKEMISSRGARLLPLPRYSPELNPIEMLWSQVKHFIKKARPDTVEALEEAVEATMTLITAEDAAGWFQHCSFTGQPI